MSKVCGECQVKLEKGNYYQTQYQCGHEINCCIDCAGINDTELKCPQCRVFTKCESCKKKINAENPTSFKRVNFQTCQTKDHSINICKECYQGSYKKLVNEQEIQFCYLCTTDIDQSNLIYTEQTLNCKKQHKVKLCSKCFQIFKKIEKRCPVCEPFDIAGDLCVACYRVTNEKITLLPIWCNSTSHKFSICLDCASSIDKPHLVCRLCHSKDQTHYVFMQSVENEQNQKFVPVIKFMSNKYKENSIEIDKFICPKCEPVSASLNLIADDNTDFNHDSWFYLFSSVTRFGDNFMVSGGIKTDTGFTTNECSIVKFLQDGRNFFFKKDTYRIELNKGRHAHGSFYYEKEQTVYVIGGAQKIKEKEINYLDSIENFSILDSSIHFDGQGEWQMSEFKLKKARCSFAQVQIGSLLIIFGGFSDIGKIEDSLEIIDFENKTVTLVQLEKGYLTPVYPVLLPHSKTEIQVIGGFTKNGNQNQESHIVNFKKGSVSKSAVKGFPVSDKLHVVRAFDDVFIFGGSCFDTSKSKHSAKFLSLKNGNEKLISGGYKNMNQTSIDAIKNILDCFGSEQFDFTLDKPAEKNKKFPSH